MSWTCPTRVLACLEVEVVELRAVVLRAFVLRVRRGLELRVRPALALALAAERPGVPVDRRLLDACRVPVGFVAPELLLLLLVAMSLVSATGSNDVTSKFKVAVI